MSDTYTPDDTVNQPDVTLPEDGDALDAASYRVGAENIKDQVAHILNGDTEFSGSKTYDGAQFGFNNDIEVNFPSDATFNFTGSNRPTINIDDNDELRASRKFIFTEGGALWYPISTTIAFGTNYIFPVDLPHGATLNDVRIRINPADDALPTTKVRLRLTRVQMTTGTTTVIATIEDPATGGSYQAEHTFSATFSHQIEKDSFYFVTILGESGGDEDNVTLVGPPWLSYDFGSLDLGR